MPELPEITALAERLADRVQGHVLTSAVPLQFSGLKTVVPGPESLVGREVAAVGRRGKYLVFEFSGPRLLVHLSQGGRVDVEDPPKATRPKGAVVRFTFEVAGSVGAVRWAFPRLNELELYLPQEDSRDNGFTRLRMAAEHPPQGAFIPSPGQPLGYPDTKVILVSDYPEAQEEAVKAGAMKGFGKSLMGSEELTEKVRQALSQ